MPGIWSRLTLAARMLIIQHGDEPGPWGKQCNMVVQSLPHHHHLMSLVMSNSEELALNKQQVAVQTVRAIVQFGAMQDNVLALESAQSMLPASQLMLAVGALLILSIVKLHELDKRSSTKLLAQLSRL